MSATAHTHTHTLAHSHNTAGRAQARTAAVSAPTPARQRPCNAPRMPRQGVHSQSRGPETQEIAKEAQRQTERRNEKEKAQKRSPRQRHPHPRTDTPVNAAVTLLCRGGGDLASRRISRSASLSQREGTHTGNNALRDAGVGSASRNGQRGRIHRRHTRRPASTTPLAGAPPQESTAQAQRDTKRGKQARQKGGKISIQGG